MEEELSKARLEALAIARAAREIERERRVPPGWKSIDHLLMDTREFCGRQYGRQTMLARFLGVDSSTLTKWLTNKKLPVQDTIDAIAQWRQKMAAKK